MANDEFDIYFARAKIEENWNKDGVTQRRCSLPVIASSDLLQSRHRRGTSVKNARKKSVPYGPHEFSSHAFPSPIMEVTSPEIDDDRTFKNNNNSSSEILNDNNQPQHQDSMDYRMSRGQQATVFIYPNIDLTSGDQTINEMEDEDIDEDSDEKKEQDNYSFQLHNNPPQQRSDSELCVVRNFKTSSKGIVNRGDSVKRTRRASTATCQYEPLLLQSRQKKIGVICPPELSSLDLSATHTAKEVTRLLGSADVLHQTNNPDIAAGGPICSNVVIIGEKGVGKSALIRQFMTSNYMGPLDSPQEQTSSCINLSVALDGEETNIELHEVHAKQVSSFASHVSAYLLVFAVDSQSSYEGVKSLIDRCRSRDVNAALILVANKTDLARRRVISSHDAKSLCRRVKCKYVEVSVTLNHNVDNLLVGTVKQIQLNPLRTVSKGVESPHAKDSSACFPLPKGLAKRFSLKNVGHHSADCENLSVL